MGNVGCKVVFVNTAQLCNFGRDGCLDTSWISRRTHEEGDRLNGTNTMFSRNTCAADNNTLERLCWVNLDIFFFIGVE
jgi:hypothetical protein